MQLDSGFARSRRSAFIAVVALALAAVAIPRADAVVSPDLVGHWTFEAGEELEDKTGHFEPLTLFGATVTDGALDVDDASTHAISGNYTGPTIREKTLVSWLSLDDLDVRSGSVLTIDNRDVDNFDGIVYAEREPLRWMAGSTNFARTQDAVVFEETAAGQPIQMAISYRDLTGGDVEITICRNGSQIGQYTSSNMTEWTSGNAEAIFGRRHTPGTGTDGPGFVDAKIDEARIYSGVLTCPEVGMLRAVSPGICDRSQATIWVDDDRIIHGGPQDGQRYGDTLHGTAGDDTIVGTPRADIIHGYSGNDVICGWGGDDDIFAGANNDIVHAGRGDDVVHGNGGNDRLNGNEDDDTLRGGSGNDRLRGGTGADTLDGGPGRTLTPDFSPGEGDVIIP